MAIAFHGTAGAKANAGGASPPYAVTPVLPGSMSSGAIVILSATTIAGATITMTAVGSIATWTQVTGSPVDVTGGDKLYVWWGLWTSGTTGPTVSTSSDHICSGTVAYSGCNDSVPINTQATGSETTSDQ